MARRRAFSALRMPAHLLEDQGLVEIDQRDSACLVPAPSGNTGRLVPARRGRRGHANRFPTPPVPAGRLATGGSRVSRAGGRGERTVSFSRGRGTAGGCEVHQAGRAARQGCLKVLPAGICGERPRAAGSAGSLALLVKHGAGGVHRAEGAKQLHVGLGVTHQQPAAFDQALVKMVR